MRTLLVPVLVVLGGAVLLVGGAFVVGDLVVPAWVVAGVLFLGAAWVHFGTRTRKDLPHPSWRSVLVALALAATGGAAGLEVVSDRTCTIVSPHGPDGCRVVAVEEFFLLDGSTDAFVVGSWIGWVDGPPSEQMRYHPYAAGDHTLTWDGDIPTLTRPDQGSGPADVTPSGSGC